MFECSKECVDVIDEVISSVMEHYHIRYVNACLGLGICRGLVAVLNGNVCGVGVYYVVESYPHKVGVHYYVAVKAEFRGMGVGKALISSMEELMSSDHVSIYLATAKSGNEVIKSILSRLGYIEVPLNSLGRLSDVVKKLTCGYDDDLLFMRLYNNLNKSPTSALDFLTAHPNSDLINKLWRKLCYDVWRNTQNIDVT